MTTENPRVWFKSISLENVRSFGTEQTINFTDKDGNAARWNVILGDNGTGKTTVLRSLFVSANDESEVDYLTNGYSYFLRYEDTPILIRSLLEGLDGEILTVDEYSISLALMAYQSKISGKEEYSFQPLWKVNGEETNKQTGLLIYGYGASRRMNDTESLSKDSGNTFESLFSDDVGLLDVEGWILRSDYMALRDEKFRQRYDLIKDILLRLLRGEILELNIYTVMDLPQVFFKTHYGDVRLHELSLGYKTLIAWMVDFAKGLLDRYPNSPDPLAEPAVCLVDEIDLHLHPKFQRTIIKFLTDTFPNTQFIVTAHSPLIVQSAEDANIIVLKREGNQTVVESDRINVHDWRIDQILSSNMFGGIGGRAPDVEEKMKRRRALLRKDEITDAEKLELAALEKELGNLPVSESREALKALDIIGQALVNQT